MEDAIIFDCVRSPRGKGKKVPRGAKDTRRQTKGKRKVETLHDEGE